MEHRILKIKVDAQLKKLLQEEDLDRDLKITIKDPGPKQFILQTIDGEETLIQGHYALSNLLRHLAREHQNQKLHLNLDLAALYKSPLEQLTHDIEEHYWDALTRHFSPQGLVHLLEDSKSDSSKHFWIYIPQADDKAYQTFTKLAHEFPFLKLKVLRLHRKLSDLECLRLNQRPGLLSLSLNASPDEENPFVVPGGRFNEMYGWDSFFIIQGLLKSSRVKEALSMLNHLLYQIKHYGHVLNANRSYYLQRSQPPLLTSIIRLLQPHLSPKQLDEALNLAIQDYFHVWMSDARCPEGTLSRYYGFGHKEPIEVEPGHFDHIYLKHAQKHKLTSDAFREAYLSGDITEPKLDEYFLHDRSMRESGHDTTNRLINKSAHLYPVCLNSLLFKYENDIADLIRVREGRFSDPRGQQHLPEHWEERASKRKEWVNQLLWCDQEQIYYDYDFALKQPRRFKSATAFYPLFSKLASSKQANLLITRQLQHFEQPGGVCSTTKNSRDEFSDGGPQRQWDFPFGWAPHQMIFWQGAKNYGYLDDAQRLAYKWLYLVMCEARDYNGAVTEKYDVVQGTSQCHAEYGNVGAEFDFFPEGGFAWTNASFLVGQAYLNEKLIESLKKCEDPLSLF